MRYRHGKKGRLSEGRGGGRGKASPVEDVFDEIVKDLAWSI